MAEMNENFSNKSTADSLESSSSHSNNSCEIIEPLSPVITHSLSEHHISSKHTRHLPSRMALQFLSPNKTIRLPKNHSIEMATSADTIANHIELQKDLMQDNPISEMRRIEALRDIPQCLTVKRSIKAKLNQSINEKMRWKNLSCWKQVKYSVNFSFMQALIAINDVRSAFKLWHSSIKSIEGQFGSGVATYFKFLRWLLILNLIHCTFSIFFITIPQSLLTVHSGDIEFNFADIFIGDGFLENTILYYGFYSNTTIENSSGYKYNIPTAYVASMFCCYILTFILLSVKVARSYRECYIETSGGFHNLYATKIFCSWDYSIASSKAAKLCSTTIYCELIELLAERNLSYTSNRLSKYLRLFIQIIITTIVLAAMGGIGFLTWYLLRLHITQGVDAPSLLVIPLTITGIMTISPIIMSQLVKLERYNSKRNILYIIMIKVYTMAIIVIATLLFYWLSYSAIDCWQTKLAQEIYRLIIFDFIIFIIGSFIVSAVHYQIHLKIHWCQSIGAPKFDIAQNTLNLIYNQILFWIAFYFSPPLSLIIVIKMILTFYIKKFGLIMHCEPPSIPWRAAQTQTLFLALAFLGMTGTLTMLGYVITSVQSSGCGPFRMYNFTWEAIVEEIFKLRRDSEVWRVITTLAKPGVGAAILIAMSITVYWLRAKAEANKSMVGILREMLVLESRDKDFLLNEFSKVADEDWLRRRTAFNESRMSNRDVQYNSSGLSMIKKNNRIPAGDGTLHNSMMNTSSPSSSKINVILHNA
ncbi:hypothetical protein PV325_000693 [Microctonus aethiopoides]|nr:hypothetical protein PV325_000693 [Microctonus aethiopoides]